MAKDKNDYFKLIGEQMEYCVRASDLLVEILHSFSASQIPAHKEKMHEIENQADDMQHRILTRLSREFITPIDQEDILSLVQTIDDVIDALDEVVMELYMYHIDTLPDDAPALSQLVSRCVRALNAAVKELKNFKKPKTLRQLLVEVNTAESEADAAYMQAIYKLFSTETQSRVLFGNKAIYESLENCCDLCEQAANVMEQIIIRNT